MVLNSTEASGFGTVVYYTVSVITAVVTFIGNTIFLVALLKTKTLQVKTNILVGNLAVVDIVSSFLVILVTVMYYTQPFIVSMQLTLIWLCILNLSPCTILAIAVDRFLAVVHSPLTYKRYPHPWKYVLAVILMWSLTLVLVIGSIVAAHLGNSAFLNAILIVTTVFIVVGAVSLSAVAFFYRKIFKTLMAVQSQVIKKHSPLSLCFTGRRNENRNLKLVISFTIRLVITYLLWLPFLIGKSVKLIRHKDLFFSGSDVSEGIICDIVPCEASITAIWLIVDGTINPWIYWTRHQKYRIAMKSALCFRSSASNVGDILSSDKL
ncbi:octopamine receptor 2-like [Anneissia japonica]|uniref:octopamine receptor 2-like n=1 Tax=Anneissia japonica TaxID=1529436 RepID=UPI0014256C75|nr:octopamine receptor 2-like [Anneissia japonica]